MEDTIWSLATQFSSVVLYTFSTAHARNQLSSLLHHMSSKYNTTGTGGGQGQGEQKREGGGQIVRQSGMKCMIIHQCFLLSSSLSLSSTQTPERSCPTPDTDYTSSSYHRLNRPRPKLSGDKPAGVTKHTYTHIHNIWICTCV